VKVGEKGLVEEHETTNAVDILKKMVKKFGENIERGRARARARERERERERERISRRFV
jgi:hypothetical protein